MTEVKLVTVKMNSYPSPSLITISLQLEPANIVLVPANEQKATQLDFGLCMVFCAL